MLEAYWDIINKNISYIKQQLYCWCMNLSISFEMDDFNQAILQVAESIIKGNWNQELNYSNVKNYLFITFRNINYRKGLNKYETISLDDNVKGFDDIKVADTIPVNDEEYCEGIAIDVVSDYIKKEYGEDILNVFFDKLQHKQCSMSKDTYICILNAVRAHFYPNVDKWYGDYEKTLLNKKKLKQWRLEHPNAPEDEYRSYWSMLNAEYRKEAYNRNREKYLKYCKEYYHNNKDYFIEYNKKR